MIEATLRDGRKIEVDSNNWKQLKPDVVKLALTSQCTTGVLPEGMPEYAVGGSAVLGFAPSDSGAVKVIEWWIGCKLSDGKWLKLRIPHKNTAVSQVVVAIE